MIGRSIINWYKWPFLPSFFPSEMFLLLLFVPLSYAHSHVECTKLVNGRCEGYAVYYAYNKQGFENTPESKDRNYIVSEGTRSCPVGVGERYTNEYPMATVSPGEQVTIQWPPRGHTSQPNSAVWVYCFKEAGDFTQVTEKKQFEAETELVAEMEYGNCEGDDVSWAVCTGSFMIPSSWKEGEIRSCRWVWTLSGSQTYVDCFEYNVNGQNGTFSGQPKRNSTTTGRRQRRKCYG